MGDPRVDHVDAGDATELVRSEKMRVFVPVGRQVIGDVEIGPNPFTPNGDGSNDGVHIAFSVFKVYVSVPALVEIWDLSGRRIRRMKHQQEKSSGRYDMEWDGRDEEGKTVPPGTYVVRIEMESVSGERAEDIAVMRTVSVAY